MSQGSKWIVVEALAEAGITRWEPGHLHAIAPRAAQYIPRVSPADLGCMIPDLDLWDLWPVQLVDGAVALFDGWSLWMILSAPVLPDPDLRHDVARIRLVSHKDGLWQDCGNLLPDGLNIGSREWAGSALYDPATQRLTLFYTASGYQGEETRSFAQRLCQTHAQLMVAGGAARTSGWSPVEESVRADGIDYMVVDQAEGVPGFIKGFRDPAHFRDPATDLDYLFFTGSLQASRSDWNGVIGVARSYGGHQDWALLPPVFSADGLCNELERPVMIFRDGCYYLFWSTQRKVFAPGGPSGPNGLYGAVGPSPIGPFELLNGTGLVAANPETAPFQTYSWWVTQDLTVHGFVDLTEVVGPEDIVDDPAWRRAHFGGVPAPVFRIVLDGACAFVAGSDV